MVRVLAASLAVAAANNMLPSMTFDATPNGALCNPCFQLGGQSLNLLLNYILNAGVISGCGQLCRGALPQGGVPTEACELVCAGVGIKEFIKAINKADLDPIYLCEVLHACPVAPDDAYLELVEAAASPAVVVHGDEVKMAVELNVTTASGVGEFRLKVDGPGTATPVSQSFFLKTGVPQGEQLIEVSLTTRDGIDEQGFPKTFMPGQYNFTFWVCQGECGSKHPHSKDFGRINGTFTLSNTIQV
jgi:hypothetical protein